MDLETKTVAELTALYNTKARRPIKKFDSKTVAVTRIVQLCENEGLKVDFNRWIFVEADEAPPPVKVAPEPTKKKAPATKAKPAEKPAKKAVKKSDGATRGRARFTPDMVIKVLRVEQPKKITKRNPYAVYKTGMTVQQAMDKGVLRRDINWDASDKRPGGPVIRVMPKAQYDLDK